MGSSQWLKVKAFIIGNSACSTHCQLPLCVCVAHLLVQSPQNPSSLTHACYDLPAMLPLRKPSRNVAHLIIKGSASGSEMYNKRGLKVHS